MRLLTTIVLTLLAAACAGQRAARVDCLRHLEPINVPEPRDASPSGHASEAEESQP